MREPDFDIVAAHRWFAAHCFNSAWDLIDKANRTPDEDEQMLRLSHASIYHWTQRPDCAPVKMSIGYWQLSRIYVLLKQPDKARHYGQLSLDNANASGVGPFFRAFSHEAMARAEALAGNRDLAVQHVTEGRRIAEEVPDLEDRKSVLADLATVPVPV